MATDIREYDAETDPNLAVDPYFYGWRMVPRTTPTGVEYDQVPLTRDDVLHPEEDDFIVQNEAHDRNTVYLKCALRELLPAREGYLVLHDHRIDYQVPGMRPLGPDLAVFANFAGEWDPMRGTFPAKEMGAEPLAVFEITSPATVYHDLSTKVWYFERAKIPNYVIVHSRRLPNSASADEYEVLLYGYRLSKRGYVRYEPEERGLWVGSIRAWFRLEGYEIYCYRENGEKIPDTLEYSRLLKEAKSEAAEAQKDAKKAQKEAERERHRADAEAARVKELEAELRRLRGE